MAGALITASQEPGRPNQGPAVLADAFPAVRRVSGAVWASVERVVLPLAGQLALSDLDDGLRVACAPTLDSSGDLEWADPVTRYGNHYYRAAVDEAAVTGRQDDIAGALRDAGCHVALLPELSCGPASLEGWERAVRAAGSQLRFVFAGTGDLDSGARPVNAGWLLAGATGERLVRQDKLFGFTLTPKHIADWDLPLPDDHALDEDIERAERLTLVQTGVGWLATVICQDLGELAALDDTIIEHGVRLLLAPVFSEPSAAHFWEHQKAKHYAENAGTTTVVANSLLVHRYRVLRGSAAVALGHGPAGTDVLTRNTRRRSSASSSSRTRFAGLELTCGCASGSSAGEVVRAPTMIRSRNSLAEAAANVRRGSRGES